ncbi:unnamed protein product [Amoebophrya sp. A120]|nr:unnamed protein product [Amoebophrya sp. A120]|eukprot:GSA120T00000755001.1
MHAHTAVAYLSQGRGGAREAGRTRPVDDVCRPSYNGSDFSQPLWIFAHRHSSRLAHRSATTASHKVNASFVDTETPTPPPAQVCAAKDYRSACPSGWTWGKIPGTIHSTYVCKRLFTPGTGGAASGATGAPGTDSPDWQESPDDVMYQKMQDAYGSAKTPQEKEMYKSLMARLTGTGTGAGSNATRIVDPPGPTDPRPDAEKYKRSLSKLCIDTYKITTGWDIDKTTGKAKQMASFPVNGSNTWRGTVADDEAVTDADVSKRRRMERKCNFSWPCTSQGGWAEDYAATGRNICPIGWKLNSETGVCYARDMKSCRKLTESVFTTSKSSKCERCSDQWKWQHCDLYNAHAGDSTGCKYEGGKCRPVYHGPCLGEKTLWFFTPRMKSFFSKMCDVAYPVHKLPGKIIRGGDDSDRLTEIDEVAMQDLDKSKQQEFNDMMLQSFKTGGALLKTAFSAGQGALLKLMRLVSKKTAVHDNDLPSDCIRDYSVNCPVNWDEDDDGYCSAPPTYTGLCPSRISFLTLTKEMKRAASGHCDFAWPCHDELTVPSFHVFL